MTVATKERTRRGGFQSMANVIPEGQRGIVAIEHFDATNEGNYRAMMHPEEYVTPGRYARLKIGGAVVMSDTDYEQRTNVWAVLEAKGDVLIGGLGLGMIALPILRKAGVHSVTIVEKNPDVVALVEEPLRRAITGNQSAGLVIWSGHDIHTWRPIPINVCRFDFIYFDIWTNLCTDDIEDMKGLHRAFRKYLKPGGKIDSWQYDYLRERRRDEKRRGW